MGTDPDAGVGHLVAGGQRVAVHGRAQAADHRGAQLRGFQDLHVGAELGEPAGHAGVARHGQHVPAGRLAVQQLRLALGRAAAQQEAGVGLQAQPGGADVAVLLPGEVGDLGVHVHVVGDRLGQVPGQQHHLADDPVQPEHAVGAAAAVIAGQVPVAAPGVDRPRLDLALGRVHLAGLAVAEGHRPPVADGLQQRLEGAGLGAHPRLDPGLADVADLDARALELEQRRGGVGGQDRLLPEARRDTQHRRLVPLQADLGQVVGVLGDAVADLVLEQRAVGPGLQRDAHLPELVLVPLEHPLEGVVRGAFAVGLQRGAQTLLGHVLLGREQADDQVHQPLGLRGGHRGSPTTTRVRVNGSANGWGGAASYRLANTNG